MHQGKRLNHGEPLQLKERHALTGKVQRRLGPIKLQTLSGFPNESVVPHWAQYSLFRLKKSQEGELDSCVRVLAVHILGIGSWSKGLQRNIYLAWEQPHFLPQTNGNVRTAAETLDRSFSLSCQKRCETQIVAQLRGNTLQNTGGAVRVLELIRAFVGFG